ncbi:MAG: M28 family peptidase, partial [Gemmatimonadetes bacterium]|nr:M28 family peptidase [Gemmatimonadota bacterium]
AWDGLKDPAPGADDNATGVATLIEAARLLSGLEFDFDIYFVAFQGEEQGLIGSAAFADSVAAAGQTVYGVLNVDMLGYNAVRNEADIVTNETSEWLADFIVETSELFVPDLPLEKHVVLFGRSDHASFWSVGIDAVLLFEDINLPYPGYHTFVDLWDTVFPPSGRPNAELQFQLAVQLAVGTVARWGVHYEAPDLALPAGELVVQPIGNSAVEVGDNVVLTARVHNYGPSSLSFNGNTTDTLTARVTFYDGDPDEGAPQIASVDRRAFFPAGGVVPLSATWTVGEGQEGFHEIHAVVEGLDAGYTQSEPSDTNNRNSVSLFVESPFGSAPAILRHYVYPNPVTGSRNDFRFYFELTRDAQRVTIEVFDLLGTPVGLFGATGGFVGDGNQAGSNELTASDFRWTGENLESGVYLYAIRVFGNDGLADVGEGKFGLVR